MLSGFLTAAEQHPELGTHILVLPSVTQAEDSASCVLRLDFSSGEKAYTYERLCEEHKTAKAYAKSVIADIVKGLDTDLEKAGAIHDYLALHITYDHTFSPSAFTAYGALIDGKAVCQGYSGAFNLLGEAAGLDVFAVANRTHMWNAVRTDGKTYYYDVTFDDADDVLSDAYRGLSSYTPEESGF